MQGRKNYQEKLFTSFQLSDRVPEENIYRQILKLIDFHFLYRATAPYYGKEGQASVDPVVFFKLMLVGYLENITSDRKIIQSASMRMDVLFFIGYDIDEPLPWHSTLSRTRKLYGENVFLSLFQEVLKQCIHKGMLSGRRQAVDSVLIKANASMESLLEKEILADAATYSSELKDNEDDNDGKTRTMPIVKSKDERFGKRQKRNNKTHYSPSDPDSRIATKPGKPYLLSYLGQVSVDTGSHVITHAQAFHADKRDSQCLGEVLDQTVDNLGREGLIMEEVLADTNYSSTESLEKMEKMELKGYIPNFGGFKPEREGFIYNEEHDHYVCSQGKQLKYRGIKKNHSISKQYLSKASDCRDCPKRLSCIGKSNQKMITETLSRPLFMQMEHRVKSRKGQRMKKLRHSTVEPVIIGTLVNYLNMKKLNTKGLSNANKCLLMSAIAYNLKKLIKFKPLQAPNWSRKSLIDRINNKISQFSSVFSVMRSPYL
ncbi:transposase [Marivirga lumbricoides]|uniref:Transposase n=1 Tax=Marivirga lumbricoides TaxID=1046115 RepID=A0ABQ1LYH7_9BACT|nr:transposase [Marivirga lumbricoides]